MRCLYCDKELALLKRWTGGGEFCSDTHRQSYQQEYNQLALNRLLQAKPPGEAKPALAAKSSSEAKPISEAKLMTQARPAAEIKPARAFNPPAVQPSSRPNNLHQAESPTPASRAVEAPVVSIPIEESKPVLAADPVLESKREEEPAPTGLFSFIPDFPLPAMAEVMAMSRPDAELVRSATAVLPHHHFDSSSEQQLATAGQVVFAPANRVLDSAIAQRDRRLEVRDFARSAPVVEIRLFQAGETGLENIDEAMDILIFPRPPQGSPALFEDPPLGFTAIAPELGDLTRLAFHTTGLQDHQGDDVETGGQMVALASAIESPLEPTVPAQEENTQAVLTAPPMPAPQIIPTDSPVPPPAVAALVDSPAPPQVSTPADVAATSQAEAEATAPLPDLATQPLPLVLHGFTPVKGKPVQVFPSALLSRVEVQVPRANALPLRPVMVLGPALQAPAKSAEKPQEKKPPERTALVKSDPKKTLVQGRPDPRLVNGKLRRPDVRLPDPEPGAKELEKVRVPAAVASAVVSKVEPKPVAQPFSAPQKNQPKPKEVGPVPKEIQVVAATPAVPYSGTDLGLPSLNLQASQGFWGKLSAAGKTGVAVAAAVAIVGIIAITMKGGGGASANTRGPRVVEAGPPIVDAGWITEWGAESGVRRTRQISLLRSSQPLTDYRLEFQGQIESKAIGWVFRAMDPKNYYVTKLEIVKPGLEPGVALVRFAVIHGEEQPHAQFPLPMPLRRDTMYKIRFEAVGSHFTTWVQDQKVDEWNDSRITMGGVGLYSDRGEQASLQGGVNVVPLTLRK